MYAPPIPIVVDVVPPEIAPGGDLLLSEDIVEGVCIVDHFVFPSALTAASDDLALSIFVDEPRIVAVGEVEQGGVEIDVVVDVIADEVGELIATAQGDDGVADVGMSEVEVHGMVGAEATTSGENVAAPSHIVDEWNDLVDDVCVVGVVSEGALGG